MRNNYFRMKIQIKNRILAQFQITQNSKITQKKVILALFAWMQIQMPFFKNVDMEEFVILVQQISGGDRKSVFYVEKISNLCQDLEKANKVRIYIKLSLQHVVAKKPK